MGAFDGHTEKSVEFKLTKLKSVWFNLLLWYKTKGFFEFLTIAFLYCQLSLLCWWLTRFENCFLSLEILDPCSFLPTKDIIIHRHVTMKEDNVGNGQVHTYLSHNINILFVFMLPLTTLFIAGFNVLILSSHSHIVFICGGVNLK